ncbi:outer dynein arm-docking complex subunit 4-like isoform X3 [Xyrauchen texanus]|uniref:outer dynein arm-docking complex subunit 4-like isoform X3 n=1 Tax=Xyrauchen texanus TaxID=154827 RepID=UPI0022418CB7|nr:outer dynein arm-docking complex subunit 4-like isoform X3 [Xyrauchen texanus]
MFENGEEQGPKSTFTTYMAEGDQLFHKGEYVKATESFSAALSLQPGEKTCLVARSKCYVKLGDAESALNDAEASLKDNKDFFKGLYQKAEALYTMGDFEFALVYYHRGHKLRPELQEFRLGIQKAQEAIGNSVGSPSSVKLETKGDLAYFHKSIGVRQKHFIDSHKKEPRQHGQKMPKRERTAKQLLGELYRDREYLEKLLQDEALSAGKAESSLKKARELMKAVQGWTDGVLPNKKEVIGNLHSCIGNALMDLGKMDKALNHHKKDLELAKQGDLMDSKSRALDNIGRVYARIGKFQQAIEVWEEKVPLVCSGLEKAWLFHEIGCCYLELKRYIEARDYGSRSLAAADDIRDGKWQLNASVLVAQVELKLGNNKASVLHFERALDRAKLMHDDSAREAIQKALREARQKVTQ